MNHYMYNNVISIVHCNYIYSDKLFLSKCSYMYCGKPPGNICKENDVLSESKGKQIITERLIIGK